MNPPNTEPKVLVILDEAGDVSEIVDRMEEAFGVLSAHIDYAAAELRALSVAIREVTAQMDLVLWPAGFYFARTPYQFETPRRRWLRKLQGLNLRIKVRWAPLVFDEHSSIH